jgi:hypothetical protein
MYYNIASHFKLTLINNTVVNRHTEIFNYTSDCLLKSFTTVNFL